MEKRKAWEDHLEYGPWERILFARKEGLWLVSTEEENEMKSHEMKANFHLLQSENLLGKYGPARKQSRVAKVIYASCSQF